MSDFQTTLEAEQQKLGKRDKEMIPLVLVRAMFGLALLSVIIVAIARFTDRPLVGVASLPPVVAEKAILFTPGQDRGSYIVTDLDGKTLVTSSDHLAGFIGVMGQVLDRKRMLAGVEDGTPLRVVRRENGRIDIVDDAANFTVELMGYGADNVRVFANLLDI
ncbi:photosynthetic complex assembly protein PuhC [Shimia ponticola]|uniref:photosynthetic complex assembly protein PuhC n=1 Tax=Shimia ponticola TaxID=2582893 RepID=UPI0011BF93E8|nr:photosynthetic complex assembly protein PuhC [Shimia ponticola]